ncbi:SRPBCC family protein [Paenibacillus sp. GCM10023252]|uniref:SRPBCC family protein n=1 Tax=Paenibacillus sp. GCM10023252 TaxID=3252649 RepID=UPI003620E82C
MTAANKMKLTAEPGKQVIVIEREFNAPRELVFEAFTDADLFVQWMGPSRLTMQLDIFDARDGGAWRYVSKDPGSNEEYAFCGVFHEVTAPTRIVQTFEFLGLPERGHVTLETAVFEELSVDRTKVVMESLFRSVADRDGMLESGMEGGMNESFVRLEQVLGTLRAQ